MNTLEQLHERAEFIRLQRVAQSKAIGDIYRLRSLWFNGQYIKWPEDPPIDLESWHGKRLLERAEKQFGRIEKNGKGHIKIRCRYCNKTYQVNNIDTHERECEGHMNDDKRRNV